jgi:BASS family bile acid:Na+ symporter
MIGSALELSPRDFAQVAREPKAALVGLVCQFLILPAATFLLVQLLRPPPSVALGMILVAACPGGNVSNVIVYMSGGNSALSVGMTAVSSAAATLFLPLNFAFWASQDAEASRLLTEVAISPWSILLPLVLLLGLPMALGMWTGARFPTLASKVRKPLRSLCGIIFLIFVALSFYKNSEVLGLEILPVLLIVVLHNAAALALGYTAGRTMRLSRRDCRTISIEVGIQNSGLALGLIFAVFHGLGGMAMIAVLWGLWHIVAAPRPRIVDMIFACIIFFAFLVQASAGFGSVMLSLAIGTLLWPLSEILPIVVPLSFCLSTYILIRDWREVDLKVLLRLVGPLMTAGAIIGMLLVPYASPTVMRMLLGTVVSLAAMRGLVSLASGKNLSAKRGSLAGLAWILGAGIVHGLIATGGPPLVYAIESLGLPKRSFRSTLAAVWFVLNLMLTLRFISTGAFAMPELIHFSTLLPVVAVAFFIGEILHARVSERHFRGAIFSLLLIAGVLLWLPFLLG